MSYSRDSDDNGDDDEIRRDYIKTNNFIAQKMYGVSGMKTEKYVSTEDGGKKARNHRY